MRRAIYQRGAAYVGCVEGRADAGCSLSQLGGGFSSAPGLRSSMRGSDCTSSLSNLDYTAAGGTQGNSEVSRPERRRCW